MTDQFLQRIDELLQDYRTQEKNLQTDLQEDEEILRQNALEVRRLDQERLETNRRLYQTRQVIAGLQQERCEDTLSLVFYEFNTFQQYMAEFLEQNFGVHEELSQKLEGILTQTPSLEEELKEYHQFVSNLQGILNNTPAYYRATVEQVIRQQETRLKECLDLERRLASLPEHAERVIPLVVSFNDVDSQIYLALPAAVQNEAQNPLFTQRMDGLENAFMQCMFFMAQDFDWLLVEIERTNWADFRCLTALVEYNGNGSKPEVIQEILRQKLPGYWPFKNSQTPLPELAVLDWQTWQLGVKRRGAVLDLKAVEVEETAVIIGDRLSTFGFFLEKDLVSWDRSLRVAESSIWTVAGRRLRTLLMRMMVEGRIGKNEISIETILSGLPEKHINSFQKMLPELLDKGVLLSVNNEAQTKVCLNPSQLSEVQNMINRDVTPFWEIIILE